MLLKVNYMAYGINSGAFLLSVLIYFNIFVILKLANERNRQRYKMATTFFSIS